MLEITREDMEQSQNSAIHKFAESKFVVAGDKGGIGSISAFRRDWERNLLIQHELCHDEAGCFPAFQNKKVDEITDVEIKDFLEKKFPGEINGKSYAELILEWYSQLPASFTKTPLLSLDVNNESILEGYMVTGPSRAKAIKAKRHDLYRDSKTGKVYLEIILPSLDLARNVNGMIDDESLIHIKGSAWKFELQSDGFNHHRTIAYGSIVADIYAGRRPANLEAEFSRLLKLQKPLRKRLKESFYAIYDDTDKNAGRRTDLAAVFKKRRFSDKWRMAEAFLGLPRAGNIGNKIEYFLGGFILSPLKNTVKLLVEFLPRALEDLFDYAADRLTENFPNAQSIKNPVLRYPAQLAAIITIASLRVLQAAAYATRQLTARVTSPIRSAKAAWKIHPVLGILSAVVTVAAVTAVSLLALPVLTWMGVTSATGWVANLPIVKPIVGGISSGLTKGVGYLGIKVATTSVESAVVIGATYTGFFTPFKMAMKAVFAKLTKRNAAREQSLVSTQSSTPRSPMAGRNTTNIQAELLRANPRSLELDKPDSPVEDNVLAVTIHWDNVPSEAVENKKVSTAQDEEEFLLPTFHP